MKKICVLMLMAAMAVAGVLVYKNKDKLELQQRLASDLIRFHVRANSDSDADQALKLKVKDSVVTYLEPLLKNSASIDESRVIINDHKQELLSVARATIAANGYDYDVKAYFENSYFPMKSYGDITLPPGEYEAFRVDIGDAEGKNWWCVLYPPLCFVDATHGELPESSKAQLRNVLDEEEYNEIMTNNVKYEFKFLTFLN